MNNRETVTNLILVYKRLHNEYGEQNWWPGESLFEVIVGAILTQSVAWRNAEKALNNLKDAELLSPMQLRGIPQETLAAIIKPSGYFNNKARNLKLFTDHLWEHHLGSLCRLLNQDTGTLREELLSIPGIGEETADAILLYAGRRPSFVIDAYTRRIFSRLQLACNINTYADFQSLFQASIPKSQSLYSQYHALIVRHGQAVCKKRPLCDNCCLRDMCATGTTK